MCTWGVTPAQHTQVTLSFQGVLGTGGSKGAVLAPLGICDWNGPSPARPVVAGWFTDGATACECRM